MCSGENQVKALIFHLRKNGPTAQPIRQSADIITAVLTVFSSLSATRHIAWRQRRRRRELETISCFKKKPLAKRRAAAAAAPPSVPPWQHAGSPTTVYEEQSFNACNCDLLDSKHLLYVLLTPHCKYQCININMTVLSNQKYVNLPKKPNQM